MSNNRMAWANLESRNERVAAAALRRRLAPAATRLGKPGAMAPGHAADPAPESESESAPTTNARPAAAGRSKAARGRHRRGSRIAAATAATATALAGALAIPLGASASTAAPDAGSAWKIVKNVHAANGPIFSAVTATSSTSAWAFESFQQNSARPAAWKLSGSTWSQRSFPSRKGEQVTAAGSKSASDVWAITSNGSRSRTLHWNGSSWKSAGEIHTNITAVTVISPVNVWAFAAPFFPATGGAWHYNGHTWARAGTGKGLTAGSALNGSSIWAVGGRSVAHWNGHRWHKTWLGHLLPKNTQLSSSSLISIDAQAWDNVWAVGTGGREDEGGPVVLLHYNGHTWKRITEGPGGDPGQVIPDGNGGLWITVPSIDGQAFRMLHYTGGHLRTAGLPANRNKLNVISVAAIPHVGGAFGAGWTHKFANLGADVVGAILRVKG